MTDIIFPEGIAGEGVTVNISSSSPYTVPQNKRLYVLNWQESMPVVDDITPYSVLNQTLI